MSVRYSETQSAIATALEDRAEKLRRMARSRSLSGPGNTRMRTAHREAARRADVLAKAVLAADPLELDAVLDQR